MFSQVFVHPESAEVTHEAWEIAMDSLMTAIYADPLDVMMGDLAYSYLHQTQGDPTSHPSGWLGHTSFPENTPWSAGGFSPGYVDFMTPSPSSLLSHAPLYYPSPPPSQPPYLERWQPTPSLSQPSCNQGTPLVLFKGIERKWYCSVCRMFFRGRYECERHIQSVGQRVKCRACNKSIQFRSDSMQRHYYEFCKQVVAGPGSGKVNFRDEFIQV